MEKLEGLVDVGDTTRKGWMEFRNTGLLFVINQLLQVFGWSIVIAIDGDGEIEDVWPARVKFRGFGEESQDEGYEKVARYMAEKGGELLDEVLEQ